MVVSDLFLFSSSTKSNSSDLALSASSDRTLSQDGSPTPFTRTPKPRKYSDNVIYERTSKSKFPSDLSLTSQTKNSVSQARIAICIPCRLYLTSRKMTIE